MSRRWWRGCATALIASALAGVGVRMVWAAEVACPDSEVGKTAMEEGGLRVITAAPTALRPGDLLLQLNGHRLQTCADLHAAVTDARRSQVAPLFLIRRGGETSAVVVEWPAPPLAAAVVTDSVPSPLPTGVPTVLPTVAPTVAAVAPVPAAPVPAAPVPTAPVPTAPVPVALVPTSVPIPPRGAAADPARALLAKLVALGHELQERQPLPMAQPWVQRVADLRQEYYEQQVRGASVSVVAPVLGYYETVAEILTYKEAATRARRDLRTRAEVVLPYHNGAEVSGWLQRYPFLRPSVIEEPETFRIITETESNGLWAPDRAVALLVERAGTEGTALSGKLAAR